MSNPDIFGDGNPETTPVVLAIDMGAKPAIEVINDEITSIEAVKEFMAGEERKTVIAAAVKKFPGFAPANAEPDPGSALLSEEDDQPEPDVDVDLSEENAEEIFDGDPRKEYLIEIDEVENRPNFHFVSINGKAFRIQRGVPVWVPESVLEVLNHAMAERLVQDDIGGGRMRTRRQKYSSVPFRVLDVRMKGK